MPCSPTADTNQESERIAFQQYQSKIRQFDVVHDFSHQHFASRFLPNLPSLNIFWHAPALAKYPKSPYNIIALSHWAAREFQRVYHQKAKYQQSILIDTEVYRLDGAHADRFLTIGRMAMEKGNLRALLLCQQLGVPLDICGGDSDPSYKARIMDLCDGKQWVFHGEVTDAEKIKLMQSCKALLYATDHPEVTNHKLQEALLCGAGVIAPRLGAQPEIVTEGVNGYLCVSNEEYLKAMQSIDKLNPLSTRDELVQRYAPQYVVGNYLPLYQEVAQGLRW